MAKFYPGNPHPQIWFHNKWTSIKSFLQGKFALWILNKQCTYIDKRNHMYKYRYINIGYSLIMMLLIDHNCINLFAIKKGKNFTGGNHLSMRFISCRPSPRKNLLRFSDRIRQEQRELKRFSIISISSLVLGSCLLYAWISKVKS